MIKWVELCKNPCQSCCSSRGKMGKKGLSKIGCKTKKFLPINCTTNGMFFRCTLKILRPKIVEWHVESNLLKWKKIPNSDPSEHALSSWLHGLAYLHSNTHKHYMSVYLCFHLPFYFAGSSNSHVDLLWWPLQWDHVSSSNLSLFCLVVW